MPFEAIQKSKTPEMVTTQILAQINKGELKPGSCLPSQRVLAEKLNVGRSSIREAINALVVMGYLEVRHGSGTYVRRKLPIDDPPMQKFQAIFETSSLMDLMEARETLECKTAQLAAERADSRQIAALKRILQRVEQTHSDYKIFLEADIDFHTQLAEATGNAVIGEMTKLVLKKVIDQHKQLKTAKLTSHYRKKSIQTAQNMVHYIEKGNGAKAGFWMRAHLQAIREELKDIIG